MICGSETESVDTLVSDGRKLEEHENGGYSHDATHPRWSKSSGSIASGEEKGQKSGILGFQAFVQKPDKGWWTLRK